MTHCNDLFDQPRIGQSHNWVANGNARKFAERRETKNNVTLVYVPH